MSARNPLSPAILALIVWGFGILLAYAGATCPVPMPLFVQLFCAGGMWVLGSYFALECQSMAQEFIYYAKQQNLKGWN